MLADKYRRLKDKIIEFDSVAIAFSGGVDSTLLLKVAADSLPAERVIALTAVSPSFPQRELAEAKSLAEKIGVRHMLIESHEMADSRYLANNPDRCYFCKTNAYDLFVDYIQLHGYTYLLDGTNADDAGDYRPGRQAAREHGVRSPLQEVGMRKDEIRQLAREMDMPNWDKPAAACLASRIPYGAPVRIEVLSQVEHAEYMLRDLGFGQLRVRHHGEVARLELQPAEFERVIALREQIVEMLKTVGYRYVTLDLAGFRSGSMNEALKSKDGHREAISVIS